ncbi:hypothetical protein [Cohnella sp. AR92]
MNSLPFAFVRAKTT